MSENTAKIIDFETPGEPSTEGADETIKMPAVDAAFVATLAENRQVQLRTTFFQDEPAESVNATFDKLCAAVDRLAARYELIGLKKELRTHVKTLQRMRDDEVRLDEQHDVKMAEIDVEILTLQDDSGKVVEAGEAEHARKGKQSVYQPVGHVKASLERMKTQLDRLAEKKVAAENERDAAKKNFATSAARFQEEIDNLTTEIADRVALLG